VAAAWLAIRWRQRADEKSNITYYFIATICYAFASRIDEHVEGNDSSIGDITWRSEVLSKLKAKDR
jgi:hypothetical protein